MRPINRTGYEKRDREQAHLRKKTEAVLVGGLIVVGSLVVRAAVTLDQANAACLVAMRSEEALRIIEEYANDLREIIKRLRRLLN